jgi:transcriptional regulator with XRE-family HTH domain
VFKNAAQYHEVFVPLLKELRLGKGFTQVQLAARLNVPQSYVSKYETGERRLDFVETASICSALGLSIQDFAKRFSVRAKSRRTRGANS